MAILPILNKCVGDCSVGGQVNDSKINEYCVHQERVLNDVILWRPSVDNEIVI